MAYTASALSFMLENLGKPVIVTGAQVPLGEIYNDAKRNLCISMFVAGFTCPSDVNIVNMFKLLRNVQGREVV
jgi:L-asparaginase/Glu-tRNA(Gln) amidotransferase subunit D